MKYPVIKSARIESRTGNKTRSYNVRGVAHHKDGYELEINGSQVFLNRDGAEKLKEILGELLGEKAEKPKKSTKAGEGNTGKDDSGDGENEENSPE